MPRLNTSNLAYADAVGLQDEYDTQSTHGTISPGEIAVGVVIGRASEYFDFFVYAIASVLVFPALLFPDVSRLDGTLYAFMIFALAFVARPFGTIVTMALQRAYGRQAKLIAALLLLGASTAGIAFVPSYHQAGTTAIVLLCVLRIGQGLALGGSWDGLPSLLALNAPPAKRGWYAMLGQLGAPAGFFVAAGLFWYLLTNLNQPDFFNWGWRYPFYVAFAINVVALFARLRLVATDSYVRLLEERELEPTSAREIYGTQSRNIVIGALAALASYALFHLVTVFPLSWIAINATRSISAFLAVQMIGALLFAVGIICSGILADRFGRRTTLGTTAVLIALFSAMIPLLEHTGTTGQNAFILVGFTLLGLSYGQAAGAISANFPSKYRYMGAAMTSDMAWLVGAGFAPLVALSVAAKFGIGYVSIYLLSGALATLLALGWNRAATAHGK